MRRAVKIITIEITTSVAESIPSPTTAKLPANKPIMILDTDKIALPIVLQIYGGSAVEESFCKCPGV